MTPERYETDPLLHARDRGKVLALLLLVSTGLLAYSRGMSRRANLVILMRAVDVPDDAVEYWLGQFGVEPEEDER